MLDARILAAAHAADNAPRAAAAAPAHRSPRRGARPWPVAFGAAATLVIVGGLAWQLRPVDELQVDYSEAPRAASGPSADAAPRPALPTAHAVSQPIVEAAPGAAAESVASAATVPPVQSAPADTASFAQIPVATGQPRAFASSPPPAEEPPVVFDEPSPMDTPSAPAELRRMAPPAPPAPPPPAPPRSVSGGAAARPATGLEDTARMQRAKASETAARRAPATQVASGPDTQPARQADAAAAVDASALDRVEVDDTRAGHDENADPEYAGDQPLDDQPPASVDSPQVRQAWLQRVRQLIAEGRTDAARDSLREYQRRYPQAVLPPDLRALLVQ